MACCDDLSRAATGHATGAGAGLQQVGESRYEVRQGQVWSRRSLCWPYIDTAAKVRAAALAKYPGATVQRVETDSDGIYEAHLTTTDGQRVTVEVDKAFKVTGEERARGHS